MIISNIHLYFTRIFFQLYARQGIDVSSSWGESRLQSKLNFNNLIIVIFNLTNNMVLLSIMYWLDLKQKLTRYLIYYYCFSSTFFCLILLIIYCKCIYLKLYLIYVNLLFVNFLLFSLSFNMKRENRKGKSLRTISSSFLLTWLLKTDKCDK